jgi:hypothetical protein
MQRLLERYVSILFESILISDSLYAEINTQLLLLLLDKKHFPKISHHIALDNEVKLQFYVNL